MKNIATKYRLFCHARILDGLHKVSRLRASSLVEVLVALSLASIIFVIGTTIWLQINGRSAPFRQIEQRMTARKLIEEAVENKLTKNEIITEKGIGYERLIQAINPKLAVYKVTIRAFTVKNEPFYMRSKIVCYNAR